MRELLIFLLAAGCAVHAMAQPVVLFSEEARSAGLKFQHRQGWFVMNMPETIAPGVALFDYDRDGHLDAFLVQGSGPTNGVFPHTVPRCELYRNRGDGTFTETALAAGLELRGFGMASLAADLDNDGWVDLMVTGYRQPTAMFRNNGDGTFTRVPGAHGAAGDGTFSSFLTAFDHDLDGLLDLYLGRYMSFGPNHWVHDPRTWWIEKKRFQFYPKSLAPMIYHPAPKTLYRSRLPLPYEDVTEATRTADPIGKGMGAVSADFDGDGWPDLFVANDTTPSTILRNREGRGFEDIGARAYMNFAAGAMGLAVADVQSDGGLDLVVTRWVDEYTGLFTNLMRRDAKRRALVYADRTMAGGMQDGYPDAVGWGVSFLDANGDGHDDLLVINGHTNYDEATPGMLEAQAANLFLGSGDGKFKLLKQTAPHDPLSAKRVGRGAAFGDLGRDGTVDVLVGVHNGPAELWRGQVAPKSWIALELEGTLSNREALGTRIEMQVGPRRILRELAPGESFFSTNGRALVYSLGGAAGPLEAELRWPSGRREAFAGLATGRYHRLVEGAGAARN
jgi:enediyne biosynthesis protein E4